MTRRKYPAVFMRGGTGKAITFHARVSRRVAGPGAPIRLEFVEPGGATTGID